MDMVDSNKRRKLNSETKHDSSLTIESLHDDIIKKIFGKIPLPNLFQNVSPVLRSWRIVCWEILFWDKDKLDLSFINNKRMLGKDYDEIDNKMMDLLKSIFEVNNEYKVPLKKWGSSIREISIPPSVEISDECLIYLAKRTTRIEKLKILGSGRLTVGGFAKAMRSWKMVRSLEVGNMMYETSFPPAMKKVGRVCSKLEVISIGMPDFHFQLKHIDVEILVKSLRKLKRLKFEGAYIYDYEIMKILDSKRIESFHFCNCYMTYV